MSIITAMRRAAQTRRHRPRRRSTGEPAVLGVGADDHHQRRAAGGLAPVRRRRGDQRNGAHHIGVRQRHVALACADRLRLLEVRAVGHDPEVALGAGQIHRGDAPSCCARQKAEIHGHQHQIEQHHQRHRQGDATTNRCSRPARTWRRLAGSTRPLRRAAAMRRCCWAGHAPAIRPAWPHSLADRTLRLKSQGQRAANGLRAASDSWPAPFSPHRGRMRQQQAQKAGHQGNATSSFAFVVSCAILGAVALAGGVAAQAPAADAAVSGSTTPARARWRSPRAAAACAAGWSGSEPAAQARRQAHPAGTPDPGRPAQGGCESLGRRLDLQS